MSLRKILNRTAVEWEFYNSTPFGDTVNNNGSGPSESWEVSDNTVGSYVTKLVSKQLTLTLGGSEQVITLTNSSLTDFAGNVVNFAKINLIQIEILAGTSSSGTVNVLFGIGLSCPFLGDGQQFVASPGSALKFSNNTSSGIVSPAGGDDTITFTPSAGSGTLLANLTVVGS